jgi:hypothetical protein
MKYNVSLYIRGGGVFLDKENIRIESVHHLDYQEKLI